LDERTGGGSGWCDTVEIKPAGAVRMDEGGRKEERRTGKTTSIMKRGSNGFLRKIFSVSNKSITLLQSK
jgi:hypothetical protein